MSSLSFQIVQHSKRDVFLFLPSQSGNATVSGKFGDEKFTHCTFGVRACASFSEKAFTVQAFL